MSSASVSGGAGARRPLAILLAIIAVVFIILAVLFFAGVNMGPLDSIGHSGKVNHGTHDLRGSVSAVVAVLAAVGVWITSRKR